MNGLSHSEREGAIPNDGPVEGLPGPSAEVDRGDDLPKACPDCGGAGKDGNTVCPTCQGTGQCAT